MPLHFEFPKESCAVRFLNIVEQQSLKFRKFDIPLNREPQLGNHGHISQSNKSSRSHILKLAHCRTEFMWLSFQYTSQLCQHSSTQLATLLMMVQHESLMTQLSSLQVSDTILYLQQVASMVTVYQTYVVHCKHQFACAWFMYCAASSNGWLCFVKSFLITNVNYPTVNRDFKHQYLFSILASRMGAYNCGELIFMGC